MQWLAHRSVTPEIAGSIPVASASLFPGKCRQVQPLSGGRLPASCITPSRAACGASTRLIPAVDQSARLEQEWTAISPRW